MDLRKHSRITTETQCKAQIHAGGQTFSDVSVTNLGADGCCVQIPAKTASGLKNKMMLEGFELIHPNLPKDAIKGQVVWLHDQQGADKNFITSGIQFQGAPQHFAQDVDRYVSALLKGKPGTSM